MWPPDQQQCLETCEECPVPGPAQPSRIWDSGSGPAIMSPQPSDGHCREQIPITREA